MKYNLGAGQRRFEGWLNIDSQDKHGPDLIADVRNLPLEDESAEICCLHHCLEHFELSQQEAVVKETYRVLRPGGQLWVFVPDLEALAKKWLRGELEDYLYMVNLYGAFQGNEQDFHRWGFNRRELLDCLSRAAAWKQIHVFPNGQWPLDRLGADLALDWWILGLQGVK